MFRVRHMVSWVGGVPFLLAALLLTDVGLSQEPSLSQLVQNIDDLNRKEIQIRIRAAQLIGSSGLANNSAISALSARILSDKEVWQVKKAAAEALGRIGPKARSSISPLKTLLQSKRPEAVVAAVAAIGNILHGSGPAADVNEAVLALLGLDQRSNPIRMSSAASIAQIGHSAVPILLDVLITNGDLNQKRFAAENLASSDYLSIDDVVAHKKLLMDRDIEIQANFARATMKAVQACLLPSKTCNLELPKLQELQLPEPVASNMLEYHGFLNLTARYLKLASDDRNLTSFERFVRNNATWLIVLVASLLLALAVLLAEFFKIVNKANLLKAEVTELSTKNSNLESQAESISDEKALAKSAAERNRIARSVLKRFVSMPDSEDRPGFKIASSFRDSSEVSGDFYNWFSRTDGSVCIYLVDVEGSGIDAAIQATHAAKVLERILTKGDIEDAASLLDSADRSMHDELRQPNIAVTMNLVEVYPDRICLANAGMPSPLLFRYIQAQPQQVSAAGVYVGAGYSRFHVIPRYAEVQVAEGDFLVLFSDGVTEATDRNGIVFGRNGIETAATRVREQDAKTIADSILQSVATYSGNAFPTDDQTVVVVKFGQQEPIRTSADTLIVVRSDTTVAEYTIVNSADTAEVCDSELRQKLKVWSAFSVLSDRVWCAVWEALKNAVAHGSYRGDVITLKLRRMGNTITVEVEQPSEWRDWDKHLGTERRKRLSATYPKTDEDVGGTATLLKLTTSVTASRQGRLLTLQFEFLT